MVEDSTKMQVVSLAVRNVRPVYTCRCEIIQQCEWDSNHEFMTPDQEMHDFGMLVCSGSRWFQEVGGYQLSKLETSAAAAAAFCDLPLQAAQSPVFSESEITHPSWLVCCPLCLLSNPPNCVDRC